MKNLDNLNVQELSIMEMSNIDGGWWGSLVKSFLEGALIKSAIDLASTAWNAFIESGKGTEMDPMIKMKMGGL